MAQIVRVDTRPLLLELQGALSWGKASSMQRAEHVLVKVTASDGSVGYGEAPARPTIYGETIESIRLITQRYLVPRLVGLELGDEAAIDEALAGVANNHTARGALDIALCEARAKSQGTSLLARYRGPRTKIRVSFILGLSELEDAVAEARRVFEQGVSVFKVKVGRDAMRDEQLITALQREFAGTEVILYADANECFDATSVHKALERLAKLGVAYVEEPLPVGYIRERAALRAAEILPIIADDSCFTLMDLQRELELDTFDILNIKPARTGYTTSLAMIERARAAGKGVMIGSQASSGLGSLQAAILATREEVTHPSEVSFSLKLKGDSLRTGLRFQGGYLEQEALAKSARAGLPAELERSPT